MTHREIKAEILIVGAGLGGVAAALAACKMGRSVILTEETDWIGGQLTSQSVPPDEHPWIEHTGATGSYRELRARIRDYYWRNYPLLPEAMNDPLFNPGKGHVSPLCHEPRVALAVLYEMLAPYLFSGRLTILLNARPISVESDGDRVRAVTLEQIDGDRVTIAAAFVLDATETGELLELGGIEHVIGAESQDETNELHAPPVANPMDQQAVSWCFPLSHYPGEHHVIDKPDSYDFWRSYQANFWPDKHFSWYDLNPETLEKRHKAIFAFPEDGPRNDFWHYRRIVYAGHYPEGFTHDVTMVNWPQIDYWLGPIVGVDDATRRQHLEGARQLSLSFLYWMQTEAPRHDGGTGYPGLELRPDIVGTADGLAKTVYVRESRRIRARFTIREEHVGVEQRAQMGLPPRAAVFSDSIGVGFYRIDLHPSTALRTYVDIASHPFQIPMGALIPERVENLLPAGKNIGTTHITNGCYRLHPVEWNIGEVAGALAVMSLESGESPGAIHERDALRENLRSMLSKTFQIPLEWPRYAYTPDMGSWYQHAHDL